MPNRTRTLEKRLLENAFLREEDFDWIDGEPRFPDRVVQTVPGFLALRHTIMPVELVKRTVTIVMGVPCEIDIICREVLRPMLKKAVQPGAWVDRALVEDAIRRYYGYGVRQA